MGPTLAILFVVAQNAPGQVGFDIEDLHPIPPLPETMRSPMPSLPPPPVEAAGESPGRYGRVPTGDGGFVESTGTFAAHVTIDGHVAFEDHGVFASFSSLTIFGRFGAQSNALAKRDYLENTFFERMGMRARYRTASIEVAIAHLPRYLAAIWLYEEWPIQLRKRILFELWDECAESGDDELVEGGRQARAIITTFVNRYVPNDGQTAYTEQELRALNNERTSAETFAPYVVTSGAGGPDDSSQTDSNRLAAWVRNVEL